MSARATTGELRADLDAEGTELGDRLRVALARREIERRGLGRDRVLFASDEPWGDRTGELARMAEAMGDGELGRLTLAGNAEVLYA